MPPVETIGPYKIVELLGAGAMGEVYKAIDPKMFDRVVAVKLLTDKYALNENARARFRLEIQTAATLDHPNIVQIHDYGEDEGRPYFVMEFLDGSDLAKVVRAGTRGAVERNVEIARQLCEALEHAHRRGVIHRDVKPANVVIVKRGDDEIVKLVDFGIIHVENSGMTRDGTQPGTSAYSSPEQLRNDPIDHRSDLFSLGIVLYEMFTGTHPFEGPSEALITHNILQREPESPRKRNPEIPAAIDATIMKLLEKEPAARPQGAGEVAESLRQQLRRLQSRWASTDPAEYENIDEITRDAVEKLIAWARQKEADGALEDALSAYENALKLAPDAERIQRRIPKLKHRIELEKKLGELLERASTSLAAGSLDEAREHWKNAWVLAPESEDVAALEIKLKAAETAAHAGEASSPEGPDPLAEARGLVDEGRLDAARVSVVGVLGKHPEDAEAAALLDRIVGILMSGVDYKAYRDAIREANDALDEGRFEDAERARRSAETLWPDDDEVSVVAREIASRRQAEVEAVVTRTEKTLLRVDDVEADERQAIEAIARARESVSKVRASVGEDARLDSLASEIDRVEESVRARIARLEEARLKDDEERRRRMEEAVAEGRGALGAASTSGSARDDLDRARVAFERALVEDASYEPALSGLRDVEAAERDLARKAAEDRRKEAESASLAGEIDAALTAAEESKDDPEAALRHASEAEKGIARLSSLGGAMVPSLRERLSRVQGEAKRAAAEGRARRDLVAATVAKGDEALARARRGVSADAAGVRRALEDCKLAASAFEALASLDPGNPRAASGASDVADLRVLLEDRRAASAPKGEPAPPKPPESPKPVQARAEPDRKREAEFASGLKRYRRLVEQGKKREAREVRKKLEERHADTPELLAQLEGVEPKGAPSGSRKPLLYVGAAVGVVLAGIVGFWLLGGKQEPKPAPAPAPAPVTVPVTEPPSFTPPPVTAPPPPVESSPAPEPPKPKPEPEPKPTPPPKTPTPKPAPPKPAPAEPAVPAPPTPGTIPFTTTLVDASGGAAAAGYTVVLEVSVEGKDVANLSVRSDPYGNCRFRVPLGARVGLVSVSDPSGKPLKTTVFPKMRATEDRNSVRIKIQ